MWEIVVIVVFLVIGFLLGFYFYVSAGDKVQVFLHREPKRKKKNPRKNMLEERMKKQNQSWTAFNCGLDDMDETELSWLPGKKKIRHIAIQKEKRDKSLFFPYFGAFSRYYKYRGGKEYKSGRY